MNELHLLPGEAVLFHVRRHPLWLLFPLLLIAAAGVLLLGRACPIALSLRLNGDCPVLVAATCLLAGLPFVLEWLTTRFTLTNYRLIRTQAPVWLRIRELALSGVQGISVRQSLLGRLLGYGDVLADSAAAQGGRILMDCVADPLTLRNRISEAVWASAEE